MSASQVILAGKPVGKIGFGLLQLIVPPNPPTEEEALITMKAAVDAGATAWSTATFYGMPPNGFHNIELIGKFFKKYPEHVNDVVIVLKGGLDKMQPNSDLDFCRQELLRAQDILGDKVIDVYAHARLDLKVDAETIWRNLVTLQKEGLFRHIGASELSRATLERMQKITPIAVIEIEVSLWSYAPEIQDVLAWSEAHQVPVFAYSPLGRGFITGRYKTPEDIPKGSMLGMYPRFHGEAFYANIKLVEKLEEIAGKRGLAVSLLALAWVAELSPFVIPIPGTSSAKRVEENSAAGGIKLTQENTAAIDEILATFEPSGARYGPAQQGHLMK